MKSLNILVSIGEISLNHSGIKELNIERNFADISNTFDLTLIDSDEVSSVDLELYMNSGYRNIKITYYDDLIVKNPIHFEGNVWDYTMTLVGNLKELKISGFVSKTVGVGLSGETKYNIDFNSYYNLRASETSYWGAIGNVISFFKEHIPDATIDSLDTPFYMSPASGDLYSEDWTENAVKIQIKGPSGNTIDLPIPDSFVPFTPTTYENTGEHEANYWITPGDDHWKYGTWGELIEVEREWKVADEVVFSATMWYEADEYGNSSRTLRAFSSPYLGGEAYMQANPADDYYGAGTFLYDGMGVRPSEIVKKLAHLEGWEIGHIVDTEYVPCSESFKMNNTTALKFIQEVLVPVSITPSGTYTLAEDYYDSANDKQYYTGSKVTFTQGFAGFVPYFKDNKFYYEPLNSEMLKTTHSYMMSYNSAESKVLSFQVNTKGTAFYNNQPVTMNALSITTGKMYEEIVVATQDTTDAYNKVDYHNENLDNFFGFTYETVDERITGGYSGFNASKNDSLTWWFGELLDANLTITENKRENLAIESKVLSAVEAVNNNLVTVLPASSEVSSGTLNAKITSAYEKIKQFAITASMAIYGDTTVSPGDYIDVNILLKRSIDGTNLHPASGKYLILSQQDSISGSSYVQTLSLFRATDLSEQLSPQKINWSEDITSTKVPLIIDNRVY